MTFLLKLIAFGMIIHVCSIKFPTFYGGFYTLFGLLVLQALTNIKITVEKEKNE